MQDLNDYFSSDALNSNFRCSLGELGGFINFTNSGQRGLKEFTVSLQSILSGLQDIVNNISEFANHSKYVESAWRELGSKYITDLVLNSMITVQTKPCFTTLSKIISWANDIEISEYNDNYINLEINALNTAITKVRELSYNFTPTIVEHTTSGTKKAAQKNNILVSERVLRKFVFELINFLVNKKIESPFFSCLVQKNNNPENYNIEYDGDRLPLMFMASDVALSTDELKKGNDALRFVNKPFKLNSRLYYLSNQWSDGYHQGLDIQALIRIINKLYNDYKIIKEDNLYMLVRSKDIIHTTHLSKPFLLLAGISGTGKTRFVREQAKDTGSISETYRLIPVRPDWHEPSDILGYTSRLSGFSEYVTTEVLQFIAKAWRAIIDVNGLKLEAISTDSGGSKLIVKGREEQLDSIPPYWLCLDEMNLAPVEQYFADYLSILETREWSWEGDAFDYSCDALLSATIIKQVSKPEVLRKDLGFADEQYDEQWALFCKYGMSIPFNLIVAGTVNMDETTHGFSRKVIDRALSFDFGQFFPNDFDQFFSPTVRNKVLSYPIHSHATIDNLLDIDIDKNGSKSIAFLNAINTVLGHTPFELAYRALNELLLAVITSQPTTEIELQAVWDDFLMCKVLPRIEGDLSLIHI